MTGGDGEVRRVVVRDVDVAAFTAMVQHHDAMLRELALVEVGAEEGETVPARLLALHHAIQDRFARSGQRIRDAVADAAGQGAARIDVVLEGSADLAESVAELQRLFEAADEWCRHGDLLTLATPPDVAEFRRRLVAQIVAQLSIPADEHAP